MNFTDLERLVLEWADEKDLLHGENADKQFLKFIEEVFEFRDASVFYFKEYNSLDLNGETNSDGYLMGLEEDMKLEMGDIFVTLIILCKQLGITPAECLELAYNKISKRKGKTINGIFVKEEDLRGDEQ